MKGRPIDQLVYEQMFAKPRSQDPQNFYALLTRHLILEVRQEVISYYGHVETSEAKYPGLDYNNTTHRIRLGRWQWHRRLFRAFDALRLTPNEISTLTKWEGTKWAKKQYETEQHCVIRDTAMDGLPVWAAVDSTERLAHRTRRLLEKSEEDNYDAGDAMQETRDEEDSEGELESVGVALNEQLRERLAARSAGDLSQPLDEAWEQWFKNAVESGQISSAVRERQRMLDSARAGNWHGVPAALHNIIRDVLWAEDRGLRRGSGRSIGGPSYIGGPLSSSQIGPLYALPSATSQIVPTSRTSWSSLRLPGAFEADGIPRSNHT